MIYQSLVVLDQQVDDRGRHPRSDLDDLGADLAVAGPGVDDIVPVLDDADADGRQDDPAADQELD